MHEDKTVGDVMTSNPTTVQPTASVQEAARCMRDEDVGIVPITEGDRLVGTVTDRDIAMRVVAEGKDPQSTTAADIASKNLVTVDPQQPLEEALRLMAQHQVRRLPVVEEDGKLAGILAQADIAQLGHDARTGEVVQQISQ